MGKKEAKIIEVEGNKRFWFAVSKSKSVEVKVVENDGSEKVIKQVKREF
ncbi:hypothetical protein [Virgibacillus sp. DJP39]